MNNLSKKWLSSPKWVVQILGALTKKWWLALTIVWLALLIMLVISCYKCDSVSIILRFSVLTITAVLVFGVCDTLTNVFNLRREENGITWCQVIILLDIGLWILGFVLIFDIQNNNRVAAAVSIIGVALSLIFQDKIKGAVAFIHLRVHHLLRIGDWIQVPKYNVDGEVKRVSLTSVTIYNWDTTTSIIPISALHSDHFINLQNMSDGKTYGRRMLATFVFDTSWFKTLKKNELEDIEKEHGFKLYLKKDEIERGVLNAQAYRLYLYHWLMNHKHISHRPRLIVRWMTQHNEGMPLQVYAFIIDSSLAAFEWQQSQIMEHIIESSKWFVLRLYQSPSAYDASNSNVFISSKPATYGKEENNE